MRKLFLLSMATAALMAGSVAAVTLSSEIKAIDAKFRIVILSNGQTYRLATNIDAEKFKPGDKVTINYEQISAKSIISKMEKAK